MTAYAPAEWTDFALAQLGASAALLGLVIVGISINLRELIGTQALVDRAAEALLMLGSVLLASTAVLIPGQDRVVLGAELIALGALVMGVMLRLQRRVPAEALPSGGRGQPRSSVVFTRVVTIGGALLIAVAGLTLALEAGGGLYWWPAAIVVAYAGALLNTWVLLVEILR